MPGREDRLDRVKSKDARCSAVTASPGFQPVGGLNTSENGGGDEGNTDVEAETRASGDENASDFGWELSSLSFDVSSDTTEDSKSERQSMLAYVIRLVIMGCDLTLSLPCLQPKMKKTRTIDRKMQTTLSHQVLERRWRSTW